MLVDKILEPFIEIGAEIDAIGAIHEQHYKLIDPSIGVTRSLQFDRLDKTDPVRQLMEWDIGEAKKNGWAFVYVIEGTHQGKTAYKIGKANDVADRLKLFAVKMPFDIKVLMTFFVSDAYEMEADLHKKLKSKRLGGEWFDLNKLFLDYIFTYGSMIECNEYMRFSEAQAEEMKAKTRMSDADYIEYLEGMLVMNGVAFKTR